MGDATSAFLNQPLRSEQQAKTARDAAEAERQRRLNDHGGAFCRQILAGALERVYRADGTYELRPPDRRATDTGALSATAAGRLAAYGEALRDIARWVSTAALHPHMHAETLSALNHEISRLWRAAEQPAAAVEPPTLGTEAS